ncbi:MAG: L,D-transpeptidase [Dysgonomonas sp.]
MRSTILLFIVIVSIACSKKTEVEPAPTRTVSIAKIVPKTISAEDIKIKKELLYDQYTLEDSYPYKDTTRSFQWDKIKPLLARIENMQREPKIWAILQNYRNNNGEAPLVKTYKRNEYKRIADTLGVERYQSVPLFHLEDTVTGVRYGRDGSLVNILQDSTSNFIKVATTDIDGEWYVPRRYVKQIHDTIVFKNVIVVDRNNENIVTMEKIDSVWVVRSMNPATTGLHKPPYQQETPLGMFVIQEKKVKMFFLVDGTTKTGGFAPYASRFTNGGYVHGIPVNEPRKTFIEYSPSLGTTPRSHMCVRNATSHAKFIFDWAPTEQTIVFVIE